MRGVVFFAVLAVAIVSALLPLSSSSLSARAYNVSTDADGFVLISAPETAVVGEEFPVSVSYYFLNALVVEANVSVMRTGATLFEATLTPASENTTVGTVLKEPQSALFPYTARIAERLETGKEYVTDIPFTVKVMPQGFEFENMTVYKGLLMNSSEAAFEDLSELEPPGLKGLVRYSVTQKLASQADCVVQDGMAIFLPSDGFSGPAECAVKGSFGNSSVRFTFKLLVGSAADVSRFEREHGRTTQKKVRNLEAKGMTIIASDENMISTDLATIRVTVLPSDITEGMAGRIIVSVDAADPVERIDTVGILINELNISNSGCTNLSCSVTYDLTYTRPGILSFFTFTNLITKRQVGLNATLPSGWTAMASSSNDLFISSAQTHAYVKPRVPDIPAPYVGVVTDMTDRKSQDAAAALLREYQKKTRSPLRLEDEYGRIAKVAGAVFVDKNIEAATRVDEEGKQVPHTVYHVRIIPKKPQLMDYAFGFKRVRNVVVIEHIAKESASNLGHVRFHDKEYEVIADDPIVSWKEGSLDRAVEFSYEVDRKSDLLGNTLVLGDVSRGFPYVVFVVIVPIIVVLLIVFDRFRKHPDEEIFDLKDKPPGYEKIEKDYVAVEANSQNAQPSGDAAQSISSMGDFDQLIDGVEDYIARRLAKGDHREYIKQELVRAGWPVDIVEKLVVKREQMRNR